MYEKLTIRTFDGRDGVTEIEITPQQALELVSGRPVACVGSEGEEIKIVADPDGTFRRGENQLHASFSAGTLARPAAPRSAS